MTGSTCYFSCKRSDRIYIKVLETLRSIVCGFRLTRDRQYRGSTPAMPSSANPTTLPGDIGGRADGRSRVLRNAATLQAGFVTMVTLAWGHLLPKTPVHTSFIWTHHTARVQISHATFFPPGGGGGALPMIAYTRRLRPKGVHFYDRGIKKGIGK